MNLTVSLVQTALVWNDPVRNRQHFDALLAGLQTDVVILPEMFTTGFNVEPGAETEQFAEAGPTPSWMCEKARELDALVLGSVAVQESGTFYNRMLAVGPNGMMTWYDKRHLFSFAGEDQRYSAGDQRMVVEYHGWKFCPLICYDLRFPVWARNHRKNGEYAYDVLIYVANWPSPRAHAWRDLLLARAHENQAYVCGVNRVGKDENGLSYLGGSMAVDPKGYIQAGPVKGVEEVLNLTLDREELDRFRAKFPVLDDADDFQIL